MTAEEPPHVQIPKLRCSPFHSSLDVDPAGSAASYDAYLSVEIPLPWKRDISQSEPFASLCDPPAASLRGADGRRWRPQGLVPEPAAGTGSASGRRVTAWEHGGDALNGRVGPLVRRDWQVPEDHLQGLVASILAGEETDYEEFGISSAEPTKRSFYICTHGQRDICCGSMGTELFRMVGSGDLGPIAAAGSIPAGDAIPRDGSIPAGSAIPRDGSEHLGVEFRRCSHTGGHRFAATGITFPDGYAWAHLNMEVIKAIIGHSVEPRELMLHMRGSTLLGSGPPQVADRYAFAQVGWAWLEAVRSIALIGFERRSMATDLRVRGTLPGGEVRTFEVRVGIERHVPQITCGMIDGPEYKVEPVWRVEDSREVAG